jgi:hypothetical protein
LDGRLTAHGLVAKVDPSQLAAWLATPEGSNQDVYSLNALVAKERSKLKTTALDAESAAANVSVAELQNIQAAEMEAKRQQKIEAIAASVSQRKAEKGAAKTVKRQAGDFSAPTAKRQDCDVSKPKTGTAAPSLPPSSSPTAPTPIPSSVPSTEPRPATVCQSRCGVRTLFARPDRCFAGCLVGCKLGGRE